MTANKTRSIGNLIAQTVLACAFAVANEASAITIRVPQDYAKIQSAINAAHDSDEIVVSPGVYLENINFKGKNIVLRSTNPLSTATVAATIIDGNKKGHVVMFAGTETSSCVLSGFTIRRGSTGVSGGGIYGNGTKARIERNTISGNYASDYGGGLYGCNGAIQNNVITGNSTYWYGGGLCQCNGTIQNNVITGNSAYWYGGGLCQCNGTIQNDVITGNSAHGNGGGLYGCNNTIQNNVITSNSAGGTTYGGYGGGLYECNATIQNNTVTSNSARANGGGLYRCNGTIQNNLITGNSASDHATGPGSGGGLNGCTGTIRNNTICYNSVTSQGLAPLGQGGGLDGCTGVIVNCIIWGNMAPANSQVSSCSIPSYSCVQGYSVGQGQGNIGLDPGFVGPNDFRLLPNSPCIDAGSNANSPTTDKDGNPRPYDGNGDGRIICDMGAYEYVRSGARASVPPRLWPLYR
jgi:hypothetical protein